MSKLERLLFYLKNNREIQQRSADTKFDICVRVVRINDEGAQEELVASTQVESAEQTFSVLREASCFDCCADSETRSRQGIFCLSQFFSIERNSDNY